jgi:hypothetical protein
VARWEEYGVLLLACQPGLNIGGGGLLLLLPTRSLRHVLR